MSKLEKFYTQLSGKEVIATNTEEGYIVTVGELLENGGREEFFRVVRKKKEGRFAVSRNIYYDIQYDYSDRCYYAECYNDACYISGKLHKDTLIFIGFIF